MAPRTINTIELLGGTQSGADVVGATKTDDSTFSGQIPIGDTQVYEPKPMSLKKNFYKRYYEEGRDWDIGGHPAALENAKQTFPEPQDYDTEGKKQVNSLYFAG